MPLPMTPLPVEHQRDEADRLRWMADFIRVGMLARRDEPMVWAGRRLDFRGSRGEVNWFEIGPGSTTVIHLRAVLTNQIIFDLGDRHEELGDPIEGDWTRCRRDAQAICDAAHSLGFQPIVSLSSGKGVHIELFLPTDGPQSRCHDDGGVDWRWPIALRILAQANLELFGDTMLSEETPILFDEGFIAPNEGSKLVREFNESKSPTAGEVKMLWHEGPGPMPRLPETRAEAYAMARQMASSRGSTRPQQPIPLCMDAERHDTRWVKELTGRPCPVSTSCYSQEWGTCDSCPAMQGDFMGATPLSSALTAERAGSILLLEMLIQEGEDAEPSGLTVA